MEENKKEVGAEATAKNTGTIGVTENSYEELSKTDKELQSYVDRRVSEALKTAKTKWQEELEAEKHAKMKSNKKIQYQLQKEKSKKDNALAELNAYKLKEEAIKIASEIRTQQMYDIQKGDGITLPNTIKKDKFVSEYRIIVINPFGSN